MHRHQRKHRKLRPQRAYFLAKLLRSKLFWFGLLFFCLFCGVLYFFIFSPFFQVNVIRVSGNRSISAEKISAFVAGNVAGNMLCFDTRSIFLADLSEIGKKLLREFPTASNIFLTRKLPDTVVVQVLEREAIGNWCQQDACYFVDKDGVAFEAGKNEQKFIVKSETVSVDIKLGQQVLAPEIISGISDIYNKLKDSQNLKVNEFFLAKENTKLVVGMENGWEIYFDSQESLPEQLFNLTLVLKEKIPQEKVGDLAYIDLRFGNKVFVKYISEPQASPANSINLENKN